MRWDFHATDRPAWVQPSSGSASGGLLSPALQCEPWNAGGEVVVAQHELIQGSPGARCAGSLVLTTSCRAAAHLIPEEETETQRF